MAERRSRATRGLISWQLRGLPKEHMKYVIIITVIAIREWRRSDEFTSAVVIQLDRAYHRER